MIAFFRRQRERDARERIRAAITAHGEYEKDRLERRGDDHGFMHDQRQRAIRQRVERGYFHDGKKAPANLAELVDQEVGAEA